MTQQEAAVGVTCVIDEIQAMSGRERCEIVSGTKPIGDVPGFDSYSAIEATVLLAERLSVDVPGDANIFINQAGDMALTVAEIAERIIEIAGNHGDNAHGK